MVAKTRHTLRGSAQRIDQDVQAALRDSGLSPVVVAAIALLVLGGPFGAVLLVDLAGVPFRSSLSAINVIGGIVGIASLFLGCLAGFHYLRMRRLTREAKADIDRHLREDAQMLTAAEAVAREVDAERKARSERTVR